VKGISTYCSGILKVLEALHHEDSITRLAAPVGFVVGTVAGIVTFGIRHVWIG
jgi:hypothetical protein